MRLLGRAVAFAVVTGPAGCDHIHPVVHAVLGEGNDVLARQVRLMEVAAAVGTYIAVAREQLAVSQARAQVKWVDIGHATGADDAVNADYRLQAGHGIVAATKDGYLAAGLPAYLACCVIDDRLFEGNPGLRKPLGRQLQYFQAIPPDQQRHREKHVTLGGPADGPKAGEGLRHNIPCFSDTTAKPLATWEPPPVTKIPVHAIFPRLPAPGPSSGLRPYHWQF